MSTPSSRIHAIFFDIGETLVDETRLWGVWADCLGVNRSTFFAGVAAESGFSPAEVAYVGDRIDNDILPAIDTGLYTIFIRRGPWGVIQAAWPEAKRAHASTDALVELPEVLSRT